MNKTKTDLKELFKQFQARNPKPYFQFGAIPASERLLYEKIDILNYREIYHLFKDDDNPFISEGYRDLEQLEEYLECQLNYHRFTPKHAACDWLIRLKGNGQCIGVVNLFELSKHMPGSDANRCMIGFSTHRDYRRKYYTLEAVRSLTTYIFDHFGVSVIVANTNKENLASQALLKKIGFRFSMANFDDSSRYDYFELRREWL